MRLPLGHVRLASSGIGGAKQRDCQGDTKRFQAITTAIQHQRRGRPGGRRRC